MQTRILNYRSYYNFSVVIDEMHQNITGNYYPINSAISLSEVGSKRRFTVMNDRAQGGSSFYPGQIEFM
jgi:lysosomal alpha-mannosidase